MSQPEAFLAFITTQSERPPKGVFKAELERARAIRDGKTTGRMLPILYEFPPVIALTQKADDAEPYPWEDTRLWHMVMPNNGRSITVERLAEDYETAKLAGVEELLRWASQHLNIELGLALRSDRWAGADWWLRRADPALTLEELLRRSEVVTIGIDGGGLDDLLALAVCGREKVTKRWLIWVRAWAQPVRPFQFREWRQSFGYDCRRRGGRRGSGPRGAANGTRGLCRHRQFGKDRCVWQQRQILSDLAGQPEIAAGDAEIQPLHCAAT